MRGPIAPRFLHIGDGDELDVRLGEKNMSAPPPARADADAAHDDLVARRDCAVFAEGGHRDDRRMPMAGRWCEEFPACEFCAHGFNMGFVLSTAEAPFDFHAGCLLSTLLRHGPPTRIK